MLVFGGVTYCPNPTVWWTDYPKVETPECIPGPRKKQAVASQTNFLGIPNPLKKESLLVATGILREVSASHSPSNVPPCIHKLPTTLLKISLKSPFHFFLVTLEWPFSFAPIFFSRSPKNRNKNEKKNSTKPAHQNLADSQPHQPTTDPQRPTHRTIGTFTCSQKILQHRCWFLCIKTSAQPGKLHQPAITMGKTGLDGWGQPPPEKNPENEMCSGNFRGRFVYSTIFEDLLDWTVFAKASLKLLSSGRATAVVRSSPKKDWIEGINYTYTFQKNLHFWSRNTISHVFFSFKKYVAL